MDYNILEQTEDDAMMDLGHPGSSLESLLEDYVNNLNKICTPVARLIEDRSYTLYDLKHCLSELKELKPDYEDAVAAVEGIYSNAKSSLLKLIRLKQAQSRDDY